MPKLIFYFLLQSKFEADWSLIGEVKKNPRMHIPIIGNGDITTPQRAGRCV